MSDLHFIDEVLGPSSVLEVPREINDADWVEAVCLVIEAGLPRDLTQRLLSKLCDIHRKPMFVMRGTKPNG